MILPVFLFLFWALTPPALAQEAPLGQPAGWAVETPESLIAVSGGSELYLEPETSALVLTILPEIQLPLVEERGSWVKVRYGELVGWVDLEASGPTPAPAPPVHFTVTEPEPLDIGEGWWEGSLGPYKLFSKADDPVLMEKLERVASQHARVYAERYGLEAPAELTSPRPAPSASATKAGLSLAGSSSEPGSESGSEAEPEPELNGSVLLFAGRQSFLDFQRSHGHESAEVRVNAYFHSPNTVLMYRGHESTDLLAATLIHELTHLVSWRLLRKDGDVETLPPWLEEGMAEDLSLSRLDRKQRLIAAPMTSTNLRYNRRLGARLLDLEQEIGMGGTAPSLERLLAMDKKAFLAGDALLNYKMSAMWIRYLLSEPDSPLAEGFRAYLASVAEGGPSDSESLRAHLGRSWDQLSQGFRGWVVAQRLRVGL